MIDEPLGATTKFVVQVRALTRRTSFTSNPPKWPFFVNLIDRWRNEKRYKKSDGPRWKENHCDSCRKLWVAVSSPAMEKRSEESSLNHPRHYVLLCDGVGKAAGRKTVKMGIVWLEIFRRDLQTFFFPCLLSCLIRPKRKWNPICFVTIVQSVKTVHLRARRSLNVPRKRSPVKSSCLGVNGTLPIADLLQLTMRCHMYAENEPASK